MSFASFMTAFDQFVNILQYEEFNWRKIQLKFEEHQESESSRSVLNGFSCVLFKVWCWHRHGLVVFEYRCVSNNWQPDIWTDMLDGYLRKIRWTDHCTIAKPQLSLRQHPTTPVPLPGPESPDHKYRSDDHKTSDHQRPRPCYEVHQGQWRHQSGDVTSAAQSDLQGLMRCWSNLEPYHFFFFTSSSRDVDDAFFIFPLQQAKAADNRVKQTTTTTATQTNNNNKTLWLRRHWSCINLIRHWVATIFAKKNLEQYVAVCTWLWALGVQF